MDQLTDVYTARGGKRNGNGGEGESFASFRRIATATQRALEALDLVHAGLTPKQAKRATGCSVGYLSTLLWLSPAELGQVHRGERSLASFHNARSIDGKAIERIIEEVNHLLDEATDRIVDEATDRIVEVVGAERVLAALDRLTTPTFVAAE